MRCLEMLVYNKTKKEINGGSRYLMARLSEELGF